MTTLRGLLIAIVFTGCMVPTQRSQGVLRVAVPVVDSLRADSLPPCAWVREDTAPSR